MTKIKLRRRKLNIQRITIMIIILIIIGILFSIFINLPVKNIEVEGNSYLSDNAIIELSGVEMTDSFHRILSGNLRENISKEATIINVNIKKKLLSRKIIITIVEDKIILFNSNDQKLLTKDNSIDYDKKYDLGSTPVLLNFTPDNILSLLTEELSLIDNSIQLKISEIKYDPIDVDDKRFLLSMRDGNYVYINIDKFKNLNSYDEIYVILENKNGILYLDSGEYFSTKE